MVTYEILNNTLEPVYKVELVFENDYAEKPEDRHVIRELLYNCMSYDHTHGDEIPGDFICIPIKCSLDPYEPDEPTEICVDSYTESHNNNRFFYDVMYDVGENNYTAWVECVRSKISTAKPTKKTVCWYAGFKPENFTSLEKLREEMELNNNYIWNEEKQEWSKTEVDQVLYDNYEVPEYLKKLEDY